MHSGTKKQKANKDNNIPTYKKQGLPILYNFNISHRQEL